MCLSFQISWSKGNITSSLTSLENNFYFFGEKVGLKARCCGAEHCEHALRYFAKYEVLRWIVINFKRVGGNGVE